MIVGLLFCIIIGLVTGFLASVIMRGGGYGVIGDMIMGFVGAFVSGFLTPLFHLGDISLFGFPIVFPTIGACVMIALLRVVSTVVSLRMRVISFVRKTPLPLIQQTSYPLSSSYDDKTTLLPQQTSYPSPPVQQQQRYVPPPIVQAAPRYAPPTLSLFVSHSSRDDAFGLKLVKDLRRELGSDEAVWYDSEGGLYGGESWWRKIVSVLDTCDVFVIIISPNSMTSKWVMRELDIATVEGKRIVPILHRECDVIPADLRAIQQISFLDTVPYNVAFNKLMEALRR